MKNQRVFLVLAMVAASISLATAQNASSGANGSLTNATKPITPKSAIALPHKSAAVAPKATSNTGAELARLERQNAKVGNSGKSNPQSVKAPAFKSEAKSSASGSGINATYQKPKVARK